METLYPMAIRIGMSKHEFMHSTPKDIKMRFEAVSEKNREDTKRDHYNAWLTGLYVKCAVGCALSSKNKYPENPLLDHSIHDVAEATGKTEEELNGEKLLMTMEVMAANARLANLEF